MAPITSPKWVILLPILLQQLGNTVSADPAPILVAKLVKLVHKHAQDDHKHGGHHVGGFGAHHGGGGGYGGVGFGGSHGGAHFDDHARGLSDCGDGGGQAFAAVGTGLAAGVPAGAAATAGALGVHGVPGIMIAAPPFLN
jgi:hypothetical protein